MLTGKGLAGYTTTPDGRHLAFAFYVNHVELADDGDVSEMAGQALGEMASALYALPLSERANGSVDARRDGVILTLRQAQDEDGETLSCQWPSIGDGRANVQQL